MLRRSWLFGVVLVIPLIALAVAKATQGRLDSDVRLTLSKQFPDADPGRVAAITAAQLCEVSHAALRDLCWTDASLDWIIVSAMVAGLGGIAWLFVIRVSGAVARRSRFLLLRLFKPGLYLTALVLMLLIVVR